MFSIISTFFSRYISMTKLTPPHNPPRQCP
nr:MAG TPA: hypothetical protein [Caudoviricetes sp.]